ncbi:MAG: hypothetical protein IKP88_15970 [Lachnospiraceae bacterium]|nr:hypothetical protein [Lachnospiraceae bacterium]
MNNNDKKRIGLIVSYYLSRCDMKAVRALGYKNFREAFDKIGDILDENPNNIKNMRDEFDPYFDNGRRGWYQRGLRASRQEVFDELANCSDQEIELRVKEILGMATEQSKMENTEVLKDLGALIRQSTIHYNQDFVWQDVELTDDFKTAYEEYLDRNRWKIEYFNSTSIITTPTSKNIFVPNQWFVIASYAVGVYSELNKYKGFFEKVTGYQHKKMDSYAKQLRDDTSSVDKIAFLNAGKQTLMIEKEKPESTEKAARRLWRFATDYSWWSGQKTVDRGDFYVSVVLNMLNLVNVSQGYVADIVNAYGSDGILRGLTRDLTSFTKNMEGETYDIVIRSENTEKEIAESIEAVIESTTVPHRIKISASSIQKLGGNK